MAYHVNASSWDIEMHRYLLSLSSKKQARLALRVPMPYDGATYSDGDNQLLQYFQCTASQALPILGHDPVTLGETLMRLALSTTSHSATAIRRGILGLSSLHRYGMHRKAFEFKIAAIESLAAASSGTISGIEAMQHVAAGMLLCSFEIHKASCTSGQWRWYITGAKSIIRASSLSQFKPDADFNILLDWVHYHDALSRLSSLHWCPLPKGLEPLSDNTTPEEECRFDESEDIPISPAIEPPTSSTANSLQVILAEACDVLAAKRHSDQKKYYSFMHDLSWRLASLSGSVAADPVLELFYIAMVVYLNRATGNLLEPETKTQQRISRAFTMLASMKLCERQFPLFILGCEARTDEDRRMVLDLVDRTDQAVSSRWMFLTRAFIKKVWVQDDLADGELDYMDKLSAIMSTCKILPPLV
ncbi:hypothetical protein ASPVEDRAFT_80712 [Aspergillus versicolor CBS 583.65]|uniref:Transcription factor domain-containing protein n=1 Tax=Aspergillus versicolor CBS 583.65 TaxID=1036611 RepID=A0A1L9PCA4_ASPVE|nr:uncharacterized protein ASPVEDRAFT_80712 [Aspergillus versicolor CBS 583.65]OJI99085.1 hypothetical protein ASPVEDRAFT_80712 [Aspergillus versicolor CBS 583.65]